MFKSSKYGELALNAKSKTLLAWRLNSPKENSKNVLVSPPPSNDLPAKSIATLLNLTSITEDISETALLEAIVITNSALTLAEEVNVKTSVSPLSM